MGPYKLAARGIEPHPNDKKDAYQKITLSSKAESQTETSEQNNNFLAKKVELDLFYVIILKPC